MQAVVMSLCACAQDPARKRFVGPWPAVEMQLVREEGNEHSPLDFVHLPHQGLGRL